MRNGSFCPIRFPSVNSVTLLIPILIVACTSQQDIVRDVPLEQTSGLSAADFLREQNIRCGWNMGNTFDSWNNGIAGETMWGNPRVTQALMDGLKTQGFDIIRIPVTWMGHIGPAPGYIISEERLQRVAEVVDMAHNAGLVVIINVMHDGVTDRTKEAGWLSVQKAERDKKDYTRITAQFTRVWAQIAAYFKNYGDWLIFEPFNELHDGGWGNGAEILYWPQFEILNKWTQVFTDTVRSTGGNNSQRYLLIPGYCAVPRHTLSEFFVLPTDKVPGKQIVSFHYYTPYEFCQVGRQPSWGNATDRQKTIDEFAPFKTKFVDNNVPVLVGECGAVLQLYPDNPASEAQARQSRREYLPHIFATAKQFGLIPLYWDNGLTTGSGEKFGLIRRATGEPNSEESRILIESMIMAVK